MKAIVSKQAPHNIIYLDDHVYPIVYRNRKWRDILIKSYPGSLVKKFKKQGSEVHVGLEMKLNESR